MSAVPAERLEVMDGPFARARAYAAKVEGIVASDEMIRKRHSDAGRRSTPPISHDTGHQRAQHELGAQHEFVLTRVLNEFVLCALAPGGL
jgi:hypothetical protein